MIHSCKLLIGTLLERQYVTIIHDARILGRVPEAHQIRRRLLADMLCGIPRTSQYAMGSKVSN